MNSLTMVERWQAGRCAVCARKAEKRPGERPVLYEDHDHATLRTRGFLCPRCNTSEGARRPHPVFLLYRERHPTSILGVLHQRGRFQHPDVEAADREFVRALESAAGLEYGLEYGGPPPRAGLVAALGRVGMTLAEWRAQQDALYELRHAWQIHLSDGSLQPRQRCNTAVRWLAPPVLGKLLSPCPDCFRIDSEALLQALGPDRRGVPETTIDRPKCQGCWRDAAMTCELVGAEGRRRRWCEACAGSFLAEHARAGRTLVVRPLTRSAGGQ